MGWFDDDEDEEEKDKKPSFLSAPNPRDPSGGTQIIEVDKSWSGDSEVKRNDAAPLAVGDEVEDPLDAYMKSLNDDQNKKHQDNSFVSERLDVENEEEATSHWHNDTQDPILGETCDHSQNSEAKLAMQATFHKATDSQKQEHRQIDIQLEKVQHSSMRYVDFKKAFLPANNSTASGHEWRKEHEIICHPPLDPIFDFAELRDVFPDEVSVWISQNGLKKPTLVQSQTLGVALAGNDAIITASTGSGKTLAYLLPLATHLIENQKQSRALVLVPTRELAIQVEKVARSLFASLPFSTLVITGGNMGRYQLSQALVRTKPHLIVATPGRLLDVLSAQQKSKQDWLIKTISFLVLDEADKMLQLGFAAQVTQVLDNLRPDRQSLLTSATIHKRLESHCHDWMNSPTRISVGRTGRSSEHVEQHVICLPNYPAKESFLKEMVPTFCNVGRTVVFCATRDGCEELSQALHSIVPLVTLHGDKHPSDRKAALKAFTKGQVKLLVATDVAGRGLDIPQISTVINFDPAKNWDSHVHRVGRAGRLSTEHQQQSGTAYTLLLPKNTDFANTLVQAYTREQRPISEDLRSLARRSRQNNGGGGDDYSRKATNKSGLGYYGPRSSDGNDSNSRPQKKSRWS